MSEDISPSAAPPPLPVRSMFVTVFGWVIIVLAGLLTPISVITCAMFAVHSYGTSTFDPFGFFTVVILPPASIVAGIGLLRRRRWAWLFVLAVLFVMALSQTLQLSRGSSEPKEHISVDGVLTTTYSSGSGYALPALVICIALIAKLLSRSVKAEFGGAKGAASFFGWRKWRVGHRGRDMMYYQERHGLGWRHIDISGEMLMGRAHHVIYFASPEHWQSYPEWARHRRDEIIARIKSEFREPDYEYDDGTPKPPSPPSLPVTTSTSAAALSSASAITSPASAVPSAPLPAAPLAQRKKQPAWLLLGLVLFVGFGGFMLWRVKDGLQTGETVIPAKHSVSLRASREANPILFWGAIAFSGAVGVTSTGFGLLFLYSLFRKKEDW